MNGLAPRCRLIFSKICSKLIGGSAHPIIKVVFIIKKWAKRGHFIQNPRKGMRKWAFHLEQHISGDYIFCEWCEWYSNFYLRYNSFNHNFWAFIILKNNKSALFINFLISGAFIFTILISGALIGVLLCEQHSYVLRPGPTHKQFIFLSIVRSNKKQPT